MNRYFVIMIAVLTMTAVILPVGNAQADHYFCGATDDTWNDGTNWKSVSDCSGADAGVPTAADRVIILSGETCNVDIATAVADSLNVESTATLNIPATKKLTLDDDAGSNTTIAGTLYLQGSGSELAFITNNQTIDGAGSIKGQHNLATISVTDGETLTNDTTIVGQLKIIGDGEFVNSGTVHANVAGTLLIDCAGYDDATGAEWKITTNSSAVLHLSAFNGGTVATVGDWVIETGKLKVETLGFETTGSLIWSGGTIDVKANHGVKVDFGIDP